VKRLVVFLVALVALVACSSSSQAPVGDAGASAETGAADAAPVCTTLDYVGAPVTPVAATGPAPTAQGGAIADGTYRLTGYTVYGTPIDPANVPHLRGSIRIAGGSYEVAFQTSKGEDRELGTVATSANTLQLNASCPTISAGSPRRYSISGTRFDLYDVSGSGPTDPVEIATYTRE